MADEIKRVISVDVNAAVDALNELGDIVEDTSYSFHSLKDAKKYIDNLRASLIDLEEGSEAWEATIAEITSLEAKLNASMKATASSVSDAAGSYNALSKEMSELKKAWKATNDESEREQLGKRILEINTQLKEFDSSVGVFSRNVGNYEGAFTKAFESIGERVKSLNKPLETAKGGVKSFGSALKALAANPIGAVIMAIVAAVKLLKKGFEGNEEATRSLKKAFAAFQPVIDMVSNAIGKLAGFIGNLAEKVIPALVSGFQKAEMAIAKLLNKIGIVSDEQLANLEAGIEKQKERVEQSIALTDREQKLQDRKREMLTMEAETEVKVSELRSKAAEKDKYNSKQRAAFLNEALELQKKLGAEEAAIAKEEYDILLERSKLSTNDAEMNDKLAQAKANYIKVEAETNNKNKELISQLSEMRKADAEAAKKASDAIVEAEKKKQEKLDEIRKEDLEKIKGIQHDTELSLMEGKEREIAILTEKYNEEMTLLEKYGEDTAKVTELYNKNLEEINEKYRKDRESKAVGGGDKRLKAADNDIALEKFIADKTIEVEEEKQARLLELELQGLEQKKAIYQELMDNDDISAEKKKEYADRLAEIDASIIENSNKRKEFEIANIQDTVSKYTGLADSISSLMDNVASAWQESIKQRQANGKITEKEAKKEFEQSKKLQIATAVINGLAGVAMAVSTAMSLGPVLGPIMAAVNSATVIASTAAQIAKIKSTTFEGGGGDLASSSASSSSTSTPTEAAIQYNPDYQANITGASETTDLANAVNEGQRDTKVYVVESDIEEVGRRVQVRESESTF